MLFLVPSQPPATVFFVSALDTALTFGWTEIPCGSRHGPITTYPYRIIADGEVFDSGETSDLEVTRGDLLCRELIFEVAGKNSNGTSEYISTMYDLQISSGRLNNELNDKSNSYH